MSVELLTYSALAERLNISSEGARSFAKRLGLPRSLSSDGKALVSVDLDEIQRASRAPRPRKSRTDALLAEIERLEKIAEVHHTDFERERERANRLMTDLLTATAETMAAREAIARLQGEIAGLRSTNKIGEPRSVPGRLRR